MSDSVKRDTTNVRRGTTGVNPLRAEVAAWLFALMGSEGDAEASKRCGLSRQVIWSMRTERQDPTQAAIDKLALGYGVKPPRIGLIFDQDDANAARTLAAAQLREIALVLDLATRPTPRNPAE